MKGKQNNDRSNNQSARFTGKKKTTTVYLVADYSEIMETTSSEDISWIDFIHVQCDNSNIYSAKGY